VNETSTVLANMPTFNTLVALLAALRGLLVTQIEKGQDKPSEHLK